MQRLHADDLLDRLDRQGFARIPELLSKEECREIEAYWGEPNLFRSEIEMRRHGYGEGSYRYFANPLPRSIERRRQEAFPELAKIANVWQERLGAADRFPTTLDEFLERCAGASQAKPTPLLLRYEEGGYNRLHQDRYGEIAFPLQIVVLLSRPGTDGDFSGGEFLLTEGRPRMQSKGTAITLDQGEALVFPNQIRPVESTRGFARANVRHGVSEVRGGVRMALGLIFHDSA